MAWTRFDLARSLIVAGTPVFLLGVFLLLIKLLMMFAWYAAGVIALSGLVLLVIGLLLLRAE